MSVKQKDRIRRGQVLVPVVPNAIEVFLLSLCAWSGAAGLITLAFNDSAALLLGDHIPLWMRVCWYGLLLAGGLAGAIGAHLPDPLLATLVLRTALIPVSAGAVMFAVAAAAYNAAWDTAIVTAGFAACMAWRVHQLTYRRLHIVTDVGTSR